jgi:hypothetical protein
LIVVVTPCKPGGAFATGIFVGPGIANKGVPFMVTVLSPPFPAAGIGILVGPGTARNGVLLIIVKVPINPGGATARGILVAPGMATKGTPPISTVDPATGAGT